MERNTGCPRPERCGGDNLVKDPKDPAKPRAAVWEWPEWGNRGHFVVREISVGVDPEPPFGGSRRNQ
jgi:hypothetical protein